MPNSFRFTPNTIFSVVGIAYRSGGEYRRDLCVAQVICLVDQDSVREGIIA